MNKKFIVMAAFAAVFGMGFTACSNDDDLGGNSAPVENGKSVTPLAFNTSLDGKVVTRGLSAVNADIIVDGFQVWALDTREATKFFMGTAGSSSTVTGIACTWNSTDNLYNPASTYYWPQYDLSFIAMSPQTGGGINGVTVSNAGTGDPAVYTNPSAILNVTIPTTLTDQKDIMFAAANSKDGDDETDLNSDGKKNDKDALQLTFKHALSQIVFKGKLEYGSTITKAVVHNIDLVNIANAGNITVTTAGDVASFASAVTGTYDKTNSANIVITGSVNGTDDVSGVVTYKSAAGTDYDDITGTDITDALAYNAATTRCQQLMVLPQTVNTGISDQISTLSGTGITDGTDAYLRVNIDLFANGDETNYVLQNTNVYIKLNETTWAPGTKYTYVLEFSDDLLNPIQFTSVITPWADGTQQDYKF